MALLSARLTRFHIYQKTRIQTGDEPIGAPPWEFYQQRIRINVCPDVTICRPGLRARGYAPIS
ncbi:hypothetical protein JXJ21_12365 [candidate division KSB1 bacterium]|nr:hypothetical protein [candidate division KSB1 bacterium]